MKPEQMPNEMPDYSQPVAYDKQGRPLYAHPPQRHEKTTQPVTVPTPQIEAPIPVVHMSRAVQPVQPQISDDVAKKHAASKKKYPFLNLSDAEYVISAVRRHPIGLFLPVGGTLLLLAMILAVMFFYEDLRQSGSGTWLPGIETAFFPLMMLAIAVVMGGFLVVYVYLANKFFLTTESVIQEIQHSIFSHREQTVSLANIEDASYRKNTILQAMFDYGDIRLSTEGDETTYRFKYVVHPKEQIAKLNNAVEAFKNGRPVDDN